MAVSVWIPALSAGPTAPPTRSRPRIQARTRTHRTSPAHTWPRILTSRPDPPHQTSTHLAAEADQTRLVRNRDNVCTCSCKNAVLKQNKFKVGLGFKRVDIFHKLHNMPVPVPTFSSCTREIHSDFNLQQLKIISSF